MRRLIIDAGATRSDCCLTESGGTRRFDAPGMNVASMDQGAVDAAVAAIAAQLDEAPDGISLYAAGLVADAPAWLQETFGRCFPGVPVDYASDLMAAARAVCGHAPGLAAILGTGSNSCQYDGQRIVRRVPGAGFILGDEGSASCLGKQFVADYFKGLVPPAMAEAFSRQYDVRYETVVRQVYRGPSPAGYLGGFAPFVTDWCGKEPYADALVENNFRLFFRRMLGRYERYPVGIVGGFAAALEPVLRRVAGEEGMEIRVITASPMPGLMDYYA